MHVEPEQRRRAPRIRRRATGAFVRHSDSTPSASNERMAQMSVARPRLIFILLGGPITRHADEIATLSRTTAELAEEGIAGILAEFGVVDVVGA